MGNEFTMQINRLLIVILIVPICIGLVYAQDTTPTALPIFPITPGSYEGNLNNQVVSVRYSFEAVEGDAFTIDMETTSGDLDPFLLLFAPNGRLLDSNDDVENGNRNAQITITIEVPGTYIIEATRFEVEEGETQGTYRLSLSVAGEGTPTSNGELDPLSIAPTFGVEYDFIEYDAFGTGIVNDEQPTDYFVLGGQQGDFVRIALSITSGDVVPTLNLLNQDLSLISQSTEMDANQVVIFATLPQTGWYLIEAGRESGTGEFTLFSERLVDALLESGRTTTGEFTAGRQTLFYIFNARIEDRVFADITPTNGSIQPEITILDLNQRILAQRTGEAANQARVRAVIPRSGTYILQVTNQSTTTGTFEVTMRQIPIDISKLDVLSATYNSDHSSSINDANPVDFYRFSGKAGELVTIEMRIAEDNMIFDPFLILADSELNELAYSDSIGNTRNARITQFELEADGDYYILATRAGLSNGDSYGTYELEITAGQIALQSGLLTVTLNWEGNADLNLFLRDPSGRIVSWSNPSIAQSGNLQIDSNTNCETPTAQPVEHIYWTGDSLPPGDYTVWVWHQNVCGSMEAVPFSLLITVNGEETLHFESDQETMLLPDQRFEAAVRVFESGSSVLNPGRTSQPTDQQRASQGGDILILYGQSLTGTLNNDVYARFYQFRGEAEDEITIIVETLTGNLDPIIVLRNDQGTTLATNDDFDDSQNARLTYSLPDNGRYIIGVTRYGVRDGRTTGDYRITLERN